MKKCLFTLIFLFLVFPLSAQDKRHSDIDLPVNPYGQTEDEADKPDEKEPPVFYDEEIPIQKGLTYVIDRSGSMGVRGEPYIDLDGAVKRGTRFERAQMELIKSILSLSEQYTFNIIAFDHGQLLCFPKKQWATPDNKQKAIAWVKRLSPHGHTGTAEAIQKALEEEDDTIVLLTDGQPSVSEPLSVVEQLIVNACAAKKVKCHTFGIHDFGDFKHFLMGIASGTGGTYVHIE